MNKPRTLAALLAASITGTMSLHAQLSDPIPETIEFGDITLELENWIRMPQSSGGGFGRARISVMRTLPDDRMFVCDLRGLLYRIDTGTPTVYLNVKSTIGAFIDQPGLGAGFHSFAFHPEFASNGKFYTVHTEAWNAATPDYKGPTAPENSSGMQSVLTEWTASDPSANTFSGTRRELMRIYFPGNIHTMQEVAFNPNAGSGDPDYGMLYVCVGEGGSYLRGYADNEHRLDSPMGTVMRIDPLGSNSPNGQYGIPSDNPWYDSEEPGVIKEIYAYGFRNPHRITFDTGGSNRVYVGDIGETQIEELDLLLPGRDYGFPEREGTFVLDPNDNEAIYPLPVDDDQFGYTYPVAQYDHDEGIAIVAGPVYRGSAIPALEGLVFFGDIASGKIFYVNEADLVLGQQALIKEFPIKVDGVSGTMLSFVGNNRADLRWGMDNSGEIYVMTKIDGRIRRLVGATSKEDLISEDPERWELVEGFEDGLGIWGTSTFVEENQVIEDPFGDASNHVLSLSGAGSQGYLSNPAFPVSGTGSIFFRFALGKADSQATFYLSSIASTSLTRSSIIGEVSGDGQFIIDNGSDTFLLKDDLRPGIWYDVWIHFLQSSEQFSVYIRGDTTTAPSLLQANIPIVRSIGTGLDRFGFTNGSASPVLVDDIEVDTTAANISVPFAPRWARMSDFESEDSLDIWTFIDNKGDQMSEPPLENIGIGTDFNGNRYLSLRATGWTTGSPVMTHAYAHLPTRVEVSKNLTLYTRLRVVNAPAGVRQHFGLSNVASENMVGAGLDSIETLVRLNNFDEAEMVGPMWMEISSMEELMPAIAIPDELEAGQWVETWILARNGGEASGGQTFDVYWRPDGSDAEPTQAYLNADFRIGRETPLEMFSLVATTFGSEASSVDYDDLYVIEGAVLESPSRTGFDLFPGPRGWKHIPWLGAVEDSAFPWVFHAVHGWLYCHSNNADGGWFFDQDLGWIHLAPDSYPNLYSADLEGWLYYLPGSINPREFYDYQSPGWITE